eukprot:6009176-Prymnesium_polylepis.1
MLVFEQPSARAIAAHIVSQMSACKPVEKIAPPQCDVSNVASNSVALEAAQSRWPGNVGTGRARHTLLHAAGDAIAE